MTLIMGKKIHRKSQLFIVGILSRNFPWHLVTTSLSTPIHSHYVTSLLICHRITNPERRVFNILTSSSLVELLHVYIQSTILTYNG